MGGMSYSLDLRKKVLVALEAESSSNVVAARFGVSGSFVRNCGPEYVRLESLRQFRRRVRLELSIRMVRQSCAT